MRSNSVARSSAPPDGPGSVEEADCNERVLVVVRTLRPGGGRPVRRRRSEAGGIIHDDLGRARSPRAGRRRSPRR